MAAATLAQAIEPAAVDMSQLQRDYKPVLALVKELIGLVPECDRYLEIWPTGFRTYNLVVPNLLNLPAALVNQGAPKPLIGLAMYASSRAADCMYCSAHTCSFALRRGASKDAIAGERTPPEEAVARLAEALSRVPSDVNAELIADVEQYLESEDLEWLVLSVALMGFLNKFMDALGVPLELESIAEVADLIEPTGWTVPKHQWNDDLPPVKPAEAPVDSIRTYLRVLRRAPGAIRLDSSWTRGVPGRVGEALVMLEDEIGYSFPILASLGHRRPVRAIAAVLRDNLDPETTEVGLPAKCLAALVFAKTVEDEMLVAEAVQLTQLLAPDIDHDLLVEVGQFATDPNERSRMPQGLSSVEAATVFLARAASPSPSRVNEITVSSVTQHLSPAQVVEVVVWIAVLQMLHRLYAFYDVKIGLT
jgi:alkylhydroperoxidase family enzyme